MQVVLNGLIAGSAVALLAIAFQIVYLPTRIFFVGLAALYSLAPYVYLAFQSASLGQWPSTLMTLACIIALSLAFEWLNHAPLSRRQASDAAHLVSSLGLYIGLVQIIAIVWGNDLKTIRSGVESTVRLHGIVLASSQLVMAGVSFGLLFGFYAMLRETGFGLRLRALADNPSQFALFGYNVDAHRLVAFALAGGFAGTSSLLTANDIGFSPHAGLQAVLLAVVAVIIGGRTSFVGPLVGGLLVGLMRSEITWQYSARWQDVFTFGALAFFLLLRPEGLFGEDRRIEASA